MMMNQTATFHFAGTPEYNPETHKYDGETDRVETRTVNFTTMSAARAYQEYGVTNLKLAKIRTFDVLPVGFDYVMIDGVHYAQQDRQQVNSITTITLKEVLANDS